MNDFLWERLSVEGQREVDRLMAAGRNVQAIMVIREYADGPKPEIPECMDFLAWRFTASREVSDGG
ncbi:MULTISPECIES: hypothetical protein [unclassified Streptomyces]|uniref:hypothetical protein n=1 Tax=unclassified Streptomyces TaxID=2593676 RepID=UPI002E2CAD74|nr:hypothetical protein [Streptomyces sp. NBC_01601]